MPRKVQHAEGTETCSEFDQAQHAAGVPLDAEGRPSGAGAAVNQAAEDILRRLPGVTDANFRALMAASGSLAGLADLPLDSLEAAMGGTLAAKKLRDWLDAPCPRQ